MQSIKVDENRQSVTFTSISSSESAVAVLRTSSVNKVSTKNERKNHPPVSEVIVDPEKKLKFRNAQVHFKLRSNTFSQKRIKS